MNSILLTTVKKEIRGWSCGLCLLQVPAVLSQIVTQIHVLCISFGGSISKEPETIGRTILDVEIFPPLNTHHLLEMHRRSGPHGGDGPVNLVVLVPRAAVTGVDGAFEKLLRIDVEIVNGLLFWIHAVDLFVRHFAHPVDGVHARPLHLGYETAITNRLLNGASA